MSGRRSAREAVLTYALRNKLFVGEKYTLEVLESDELEPTSVEFFVEYVDKQSVEVAVLRKSRDVSVTLRYLEDDIETVPLDVKAEHVTVLAKHKQLGKVTTSGICRQGAALLPGSDALYVGMTYTLEVGEADGVSARPADFKIAPGKSALNVELLVGASAGKVKLRFKNKLLDSGYPL